jgi:hypothetical protein
MGGGGERRSFGHKSRDALAFIGRHDDLSLNHKCAQPAVIARDARLPHHRGAAAVERRALGSRDIPDRNAGEEIRLALDGRRAAAFWEIGDGGSAAEIVGQRHDGAAMKRAEPVVELLADREFGDDLSFETWVIFMPIKVAKGGCSAVSGFMSETIVMSLSHAALAAA